MKRRILYWTASILTGIALMALLYLSFGSTFERTFIPKQLIDYEVKMFDRSDSLLTSARLQLHVLPKRFFIVQREIQWSLDYDTTESTHIHSEEETGVVENSGSIWIHPPRMNFLRYTEFAPFPRVELPLRSGQTYSSTTMLGPGWGEASGKPVQSVYYVTSADSAHRACTVRSFALSTLGRYDLDFSFSIDSGFTQLAYRFPNGRRLVLHRR